MNCWRTPPWCGGSTNRGSRRRASPAASRAGRSRFVVRLGTADELETPASGRYEMKAGERFLHASAGGGGYGDPHGRDRAAIDRDIAEGYISTPSSEAASAKDR